MAQGSLSRNGGQSPADLDNRIVEARHMVESARANYTRVQNEFIDVPGAQQYVIEAKKALAALEQTSAKWGGLPIVAIGLGIEFYVVLAMGIAAIFSASMRSFWAERWWVVLIGVAATGALLGIGDWLHRKLEEDTARRLLALSVIFAITAAIMGLINLSTEYLTLVAQLIIIGIAALLPAVTYFVFLAMRRPSILNEYIGNLNRLGLLARRSAPAAAQGRAESDAARDARVEGYFQRFEAIYGTLRFEPNSNEPSSNSITRSDFVNSLIEAVEDPSSVRQLPRATISIGDIFRANAPIPIGIVTILTTLWWLLVLQPSFSGPVSKTVNLIPKATPVNFAFLGAYFFGIQMMYRRFVRRDLVPNAYFSFSNRMIIAMIGVWVITMTYEAYAGQQSQTGAVAMPVILLLAFIIGVFPRVVWQFLSAAGSKLFRVAVVLPSVEAKQPLHNLDGLTVWHETRLEEEDVENVPNMASVDVVELMLHTQIPMERLVTWIDQAILLTVLGAANCEVGSTGDKLHKLGLRTAIQVVSVAEHGGEGKFALDDALGGSRSHVSIGFSATRRG